MARGNTKEVLLNSAKMIVTLRNRVRAVITSSIRHRLQVPDEDILRTIDYELNDRIRSATRDTLKTLLGDNSYASRGGALTAALNAYVTDAVLHKLQSYIPTNEVIDALVRDAVHLAINRQIQEFANAQAAAYVQEVVRTRGLMAELDKYMKEAEAIVAAEEEQKA